MKADIDILDTNKLVNVPRSLDNLKTKVNDLDVDKMKIVPVDLKKLSVVVSKEVVKKTVYNKLNTEVNNLRKKFLMHLL